MSPAIELLADIERLRSAVVASMTTGRIESETNLLAADIAARVDKAWKRTRG